MNEMLGALVYLSTRLLGPNDTLLRTADQNALRALVAERVYTGRPPAQDPSNQKRPQFPFVTLSVASSDDVTMINGASAYVDLVADVKAVTNGPVTSIAGVDALIFKMLHQSGGVITTANGTKMEVMGCYRFRSLMLDQTDGDDKYRSLVQSFRLRIARIDAA